MTILYADTETYCEIPIKNGQYRYAEGVEVMLFAYAFDDDAVRVVDFTAGEELPDDVRDALTDPAITKVFHNSSFDRTVIREGLGIDIPVEQIHDTMIQALTHALPGSLGTLCSVMGVPVDEAKDKTGKNLINLFCKPAPKNWKVRRATRLTHKPEWAQFVTYAGNDIKAMRVIHKKMPMWNYRGIERSFWELDQAINDRGFKVDVQLAEKAIDAIKMRQKDLAAQTNELTFGDVEKATQRDKLLFHICEYYGVELPDMKKSTIERRLEDPSLPWAVKILLAIRLDASTSSTSKYAALLRSVCADDCLRGTLQYSGASRTRRWAGRLFQPQNMPRPSHEQDEIDFAIDALKNDAIDLVDPKNVMGLTSSAIRGCIVPRPGKKLYISDLSNIEGRKGAWFAEEDWKLDAFRAFDTGTGYDLYKLAYAKAFHVDPATVTKGERQVGKVMELALQYGGGVGAFITFALVYGLDLDALAEEAWPKMPRRIQEEAQQFYDWAKKSRRSTFGLEPKTFMAMEGLKRLWREAHPGISSLWGDLEVGARAAINTPERVFDVRRVSFVRKGAWLRCILTVGGLPLLPVRPVSTKKVRLLTWASTSTTRQMVDG